ncbi:leucine--tRNA ligase [archaeon]|nr:leucine--tRNA ligase [archaeon]
MMLNFKEIEKKWQKAWESKNIFRTRESKLKKKFYCLEMYPYPSGKLHMGHVRNYVLGDAYARFKKAQGYNVLHPMGYDAFGLPAENAAIKHNIHPKEWTYHCIALMKEQQKLLGLSYDWSREIITCEPLYYKWNQWLFIKFYENGLVYRKKSAVNWCPSCNTVLANEQVVNGKCWRCSSDIIPKELEQWFFKITKYAEQLLNGLNSLEGWPDKVKLMQKNWIGKSFGTAIKFRIDNDFLSVFTTRPDTLYGVTFLSFAPEHPKVQELVKGTLYENELKKFISRTRAKEQVLTGERQYSKEGLFLGQYALHPLTNEQIPIYAANFVLMEYGTGLVMCVPAHDQRDFEFAAEYKIPIKVVIVPEGGIKEPLEKAFTEEGRLINSKMFNGLESSKAIEEITKHLERNALGGKAVQYKLKDWLISRQRYWGTPIPMVYCKKCGIQAVRESELPVLLPEHIEFTGSGNPIAQTGKFVNTRCPKCRSKAARETDTMDTFVDSSWYFLRYCSPKDKKHIFGKDKADYWCPIDMYIGGIEHATGHLVYSRFFTKVLKDIGMIKFDEPASRLFCQGMVTLGGEAMSKSKGNIIDPGEIMDKYGVDVLRLFVLSAASPENDLEWSEKGIEGSLRILNRFCALFEAEHNPASGKKDGLMLHKLNIILKALPSRLNELRFDSIAIMLTALVEAMHKYKQHISKKTYKKVLEALCILFSPLIPHISEECYNAFLNKKTFVSKARLPESRQEQIRPELEYFEQFAESLKSDIKNILEIVKIQKPKIITIFIAEPWKYRLFEIAKSEGIKDANKLIGKIMGTELKQYGEQIMKILPRIKDKIPEFVLSQEKEKLIIEDAELDKLFNCQIRIIKSQDALEQKAKQSLPGKPAVLVV